MYALVKSLGKPKVGTHLDLSDEERGAESDNYKQLSHDGS